MLIKKNLIYPLILIFFLAISLATDDGDSSVKLKYKHEYRKGMIFYKFYEDGKCIVYQRGKAGSGGMNCRTEGTYALDDEIITIKGLYNYNCDFMDRYEGKYEITGYSSLK